MDVLRLAAQGDPAEGSAAHREKRTNVPRHVARDVEGIGHPGLACLGPEVVPVVKCPGPPPLQLEDGPGLHRDGGADPGKVTGKVASALHRSLLDGHSLGDVADPDVVGGRLVAQDVRNHIALHDLRVDVRRVGTEADGERPAGRDGFANPAEGIVQVAGLHVEVTMRDPSAQSVGIDVHDQRDPRKEGHREGLRSAHLPEPGGEHPSPGEIVGLELESRQGGQRLVSSL